MRVAFVLRSAEVQPLFRDLCDGIYYVIFIYITKEYNTITTVADSPPPINPINQNERNTKLATTTYYYY